MQIFFRDRMLPDNPPESGSAQIRIFFRKKLLILKKLKKKFSKLFDFSKLDCIFPVS